MNKDPEAIKHLLAWLSQDPDPILDHPSGVDASGGVASDTPNGLDTQPAHHLDPLDSEDLSPTLEPLDESSSRLFEQTPFELGDIPVVQDRFYALLKQRLQSEIEQNPPLFPWETELTDYASETVDTPVSALASFGFWTAQLKRLNVPVALPEGVLAKLLSQCQMVARSTLREGAKMVQAVEELFPGERDTLNQLAGWVLTPPNRAGETLLAGQPRLPKSYEAATQPQQMALSLLAARELLKLLTIHVSESQPITTRQWSTDVGMVTISIEYQPELSQLRVQGQIPCQGSFTLEGEVCHVTAHRSSQGRLAADVFDLKPQYPIQLAIALDGLEQPLNFTIRLSYE